MIVKFNKHYKGYNAGESASFPQHVAEALQAKGHATVVPEKTTPADTTIKPIKATVTKTVE